jgi:hypothetical protein
MCINTFNVACLFALFTVLHPKLNTFIHRILKYTQLLFAREHFSLSLIKH